MCKTTEPGSLEAGITVTIRISQDELAEVLELGEGDPCVVMEEIEDILDEAFERVLVDVAATLGIEEEPEVCPICGVSADHEPGG